MATSRRDFITKGSLMAVVAAIAPPLLDARSGGKTFAAINSSPSLDKSAFLAQLNTQFTVNENGHAVGLKLVEVVDLERRSGARRHGEGFSLIFRGAEDEALKQDTYQIEHAKLGGFSFLIVPVSATHQATYEVVVNRLYA